MAIAHGAGDRLHDSQRFPRRFIETLQTLWEPIRIFRIRDSEIRQSISSMATYLDAYPNPSATYRMAFGYGSWKDSRFGVAGQFVQAGCFIRDSITRTPRN